MFIELNTAYITSPHVFAIDQFAAFRAGETRKFHGTFTEHETKESGNPAFIDFSITITAVATAAVASVSTINKSSLLPPISQSRARELLLQP